MHVWFTLKGETTDADLLSTSLNAFVLALHNPPAAPTSGDECALRISFLSTVLEVGGRVAWFNARTGITKIAIAVDCVPETLGFVNELHAVALLARQARWAPDGQPVTPPG